MLKLDRDLTFFDIESTGVDVSTDRVIQLAAIRIFAATGEQKSRQWLLNPQKKIPADATAVHHITDEMVVDKPTFRDEVAGIRPWFENCDLAGYNLISFDVPMLTLEFQRAGVRGWPANEARIVDALNIFRLKEPRNLSYALDFYTGQELEGAHDALADTEATMKVLLSQAQHYGAFYVHELIELSKDPNWIDSTGKFKWSPTKQPTISFGKHAGKTISMVDPSYFRWMLDQSFTPEVKAICMGALRGQYPIHPEVLAERSKAADHQHAADDAAQQYDDLSESEIDPDMGDR